MPKRILVVGMPDQAHYIRPIRALAGLGYASVLVAVGGQPLLGEHADAVIPVPSLDPDEVLPVVARHHARRPLDGVVLWHEMTVELSTRIAAALGLHHFPVASISGCVNKWAMRNWLSRSGVACPGYVQVSSLGEAMAAAGALGYPVVIKPHVGGGSYGVTRLDSDADTRAFFDHLDIFWEPRRFLLEEYLPGDEVSVESVISDWGSHVHVTVFDKPQPLDGPYFLENIYVTPSRLPEEGLREVLGTVSDMIERLALRRCITHTELRLTGRGPVIVEFGLRPNGWPAPVCVEHVTGTDLILAMARIACGEDPGVRSASARGFAGFRFITPQLRGVVQAVDGASDIPTMPGVLDVGCWVRPGDKLNGPPDDFGYRKGFVAAYGASFDEVVARLDRAVAAVDIAVA